MSPDRPAGMRRAQWWTMAPFLLRMALASAAVGLLVPLGLAIGTFSPACQAAATSRNQLLLAYETPRQSGLPAGACLMRAPGQAPVRIDYRATRADGLQFARFSDPLVSVPVAFAGGAVIALLRIRRWLRGPRRSG